MRNLMEAVEQDGVDKIIKHLESFNPGDQVTDYKGNKIDVYLISEHVTYNTKTNMLTTYNIIGGETSEIYMDEKAIKILGTING